MHILPLKRIFFKFCAAILSIFVFSFIIFCIARLAPGDPLVSYYGERAERLNAEERWRAEERLGLHDGLLNQYASYVKLAMEGDFGKSYAHQRDVLDLVKHRLPYTLLLSGLSFLIILTVAPVLALLCTRFKGSLFDRLICTLGAVNSCIPEFWLALLFIFIASVQLKLFPSSGAYTLGANSSLMDKLHHLVLPLTTVVLGHLWYFTYLVRAKMCKELEQEYVLLAHMKGVNQLRILWRHVFPNVLPAHFSLMSCSVIHILGGSYVVEAVFSYPGLGQLAYESARYHDYNLLMLICLISIVILMLSNLIADSVNPLIDPRMRMGEVR